MDSRSTAAARRAWREARTFQDLCDVAERFVRGELGFFPGWGWPTLDLESDSIRGDLARLCRLGFLTLASQPGRADGRAHDGSRVESRAFVTGFVSPALAERLCAAKRAPIAIRIHPRRASPTRRVVVGRRAGVPYLFTGHDAFADELASFEDHVSPAALAELARGSYASVHDPRWGRADRLWPALLDLVGARDG